MASAPSIPDLPNGEKSLFAHDLRKFALEVAAKAYRTGSMSTSPSGVGGSITAEETVERAKLYYNFLRATENE